MNDNESCERPIDEVTTDWCKAHPVRARVEYLRMRGREMLAEIRARSPLVRRSRLTAALVDAAKARCQNRGLQRDVIALEYAFKEASGRLAQAERKVQDARILIGAISGALSEVGLSIEIIQWVDAVDSNMATIEVIARPPVVRIR